MLASAIGLAKICGIFAVEAQFIGAGIENGSHPAVVVKTVENTKEVVKAEWRVTGLGVFVPSVNARCATPGEVLLPGYTHPKKRRTETLLDVTELWHTAPGATNRIEALLTSGWWCDGIIGKNGGKWPAFRGTLALTHSDGTVREIVTDESWLVTTDTKVREAGIWEGETFDSRIEAETWLPAKISNEFEGEISPRIAPGVVLRHDCTMEGGAFDVRPGVTNVIDFAQNSSAVPVMRIRAGRGVKVSVRLGEMLNDGIKGHHCDGAEGTVYLANMRGAKAGFDYICSGAGTEEYMPLATFFGYRYASITADGPAQGTIASIPVSSVSKAMEHGSIMTGNASVNRLVKNAYWGMLSNYLSIPTDCPQRTERLGWTGDTQVFAKTGAYFADTASFMRKWMQDVRDTQHADGIVPVVAPLGAFGDTGPNAGWSDAIIKVPWTIWKYLGNDAIVRENYAAMERYIDAVAKNGYTSKRGHWLTCDWLSYENLTVDNTLRWSNGTLKQEHLDYQNFLNACHLYEDALMMADMSGGSEKYLALAETAKKRLLDRFFTDDGSLAPLFDGMQTPALFALKLHLGNRDKIAKRLVEAIHANGDRLATGFLGTPILCDVLTEIGETELAYTLLLQHEFPSWLYSVDQGATTIWERWNGYTKDKGFGPVSMNSFNHYSYGAIVGWLFEHAAGLGPDGVIAPKPDPRLGWLKAESRGFASEWRYEKDKIIFRFTVPEGKTAKIILPDGRTFDVQSGSHKIVCSL